MAKKKKKKSSGGSDNKSKKKKKSKAPPSGRHVAASSAPAASATAASHNHQNRNKRSNNEQYNQSLRSAVSELEQHPCLPRLQRWSLLICLFLGCLFSTMTLGSCVFVEYDSKGTDDRAMLYLTDDALPVHVRSNITHATMGLKRWEPVGAGCRPYSNDDRLNSNFQTARIGGTVAALVGSIALVFLAVEIIFCRFYCSRFTSVVLLFLAVVGQTLTFMVYTSSYCFERAGAPYRCSYGQPGTTFSVAALILFLISNVLACATSKSKPVLMILIENRKQEATDPCCWFVSEGRKQFRETKARNQEKRQAAAAERARRREEKEEENCVSDNDDGDEQQKQDVENPPYEPTTPLPPSSPHQHRQQQQVVLDGDDLEVGQSKNTSFANATANAAAAAAAPAALSVAPVVRARSIGSGTSATTMMMNPTLTTTTTTSPPPTPTPAAAAAVVVVGAAAAHPQKSIYRKSSFANAEIVEQDMFFDSKD